MLDEEDNDVHAAHEAGHMQGGQPRLGCRLDTRAVLEQQLHHLDPVLLAGNVQGREPVEGAGVRVTLAVQEQLGHSDMAAVSRHVQRREVVNSHLVHRGLEHGEKIR